MFVILGLAQCLPAASCLCGEGGLILLPPARSSLPLKRSACQAEPLRVAELLAPRPSWRYSAQMSITIIAHRACLLHTPENGLARIRKGTGVGADGVEIDLRSALWRCPC